MYVRAGRPAFARPCVGVHKITSLMSSSLLLQQCPACLARLTWIVFVIGGRWTYSWCLVGCCRQDLSPTIYIYIYIYLLLSIYLNILHSNSRNIYICIYIYIYQTPYFFFYLYIHIHFSSFHYLPHNPSSSYLLSICIYVCVSVHIISLNLSLSFCLSLSLYIYIYRGGALCMRAYSPKSIHNIHTSFFFFLHASVKLYSTTVHLN